jgi:hypothetical protein
MRSSEVVWQLQEYRILGSRVFVSLSCLVKWLTVLLVAVFVKIFVFVAVDNNP